MVKPPPKLANVYSPQLVRLQPEGISNNAESSVNSQGRDATIPVGGGASASGENDRRRRRQPQQHRRQHRRNDELRKLVLQTSTSEQGPSTVSAPSTLIEDASSSSSSSTTGWAKVQLGTTVVVCHVQAPVVASSIASNQYYDGSTSADGGNELETGILACSVHLSPHHVAMVTTGGGSSFGGNSNPTIQLRKIERSLERQLHQAMAASVPLSQYAKCAVLLQITIVSAGEHFIIGESGGSGASTAAQLLCPCVLASTLAMTDAGVELYDLVTCGRVALCMLDDQPSSSQSKAAVEILVDPTSQEEHEAHAVLTVAHMGAWKEITYWNQHSNADTVGHSISPTAMNDAAEYCREMGKTLHKFATRHLHQQHQLHTSHAG